MANLGLDWWPAEAKRPVLRLVAGLALAPVLIGALTAPLAFVVAGMTLPDGAMVTQAATNVALTALSAFVVFSATFGLLAVLGLWLARRRTALAFALAGIAGGVLFALASSLVFGVGLTLAQPLILGGMGAASLLIVRWIAGVRELPAAA
ncbi:hypothetical protein [Albimonas pacifica]|uniref:Uncharacterized protein n=1 Tax=Albimonas pacifica TaxID=1114924 RepID=A0A1I3LYD2_9RHOB|nr:hypothetical protein [Albimonas pacifica]SFI89801.1 hypothetical protein SAMN05216258_110233 [Albimonas pacifica]